MGCVRSPIKSGQHCFPKLRNESQGQIGAKEENGGEKLLLKRKERWKRRKQKRMNEKGRGKTRQCWRASAWKKEKRHVLKVCGGGDSVRRVSCYVGRRKSVKAVVGVDPAWCRRPLAPLGPLAQVTASGLGVGITYVANQNESGLARNQWESGMGMAFAVTSVGSAVTVPGKQTQS